MTLRLRSNELSTIIKVQGHDDKWIQKRMQTVLNRRDLTSEWQRRGITDGLHYATLTDSISEGMV